MEEYVTALDNRAAERAQLGRRHVLMVNRDPALLDFVRALLDEAHYNVTTTNAIPRLFALIAAAQPALLIIDLAITEESGWDLLVRLHADASTAAIPVIITARDLRLLAHAARYPYLYGGEGRLVIPFAVDVVTPSVKKRSIQPYAQLFVLCVGMGGSVAPAVRRRNVITDGQRCAPLLRKSRSRIIECRQDPTCCRHMDHHRGRKISPLRPENCGVKPNFGPKFCHHRCKYV